jgi:hypothetical protein
MDKKGAIILWSIILLALGVFLISLFGDDLLDIAFLPIPADVAGAFLAIGLFFIILSANLIPLVLKM